MSLLKFTLLSLVLMFGFSWTATGMESGYSGLFPYYSIAKDSPNIEFEFIPERFYEKVTSKRHIILGPLSPCIGVIITNHDIELSSLREFNTLVFHVHCSSSIDDLISIAKNELEIGRESKNISITIFSQELKGHVYESDFAEPYNIGAHEKVFNDLDQILRDKFNSFSKFSSVLLPAISSNASPDANKFITVNADGQIFFIDPVDEAIFKSIEKMTYFLNRNKEYCEINFFKIKDELSILSWQKFIGSSISYKDEIESSRFDIIIRGGNAYRQCPFLDFSRGASFIRREKIDEV